MNSNAHITLPNVSQSVLVPSAATNQQLFSSIAPASDGTSTQDSFNDIILARYVATLNNQRLSALVLLGLYVLVVLFGALGLLLYGRGEVEVEQVSESEMEKRDLPPDYHDKTYPTCVHSETELRSEFERHSMVDDSVATRWPLPHFDLHRFLPSRTTPSGSPYKYPLSDTAFSPTRSSPPRWKVDGFALPGWSLPRFDFHRFLPSRTAPPAESYQHPLNETSFSPVLVRASKWKPKAFKLPSVKRPSPSAPRPLRESNLPLLALPSPPEVYKLRQPITRRRVDYSVFQAHHEDPFLTPFDDPLPPPPILPTMFPSEKPKIWGTTF